ncbi:helix-turn-helix transcriptional regulator [Phytoactinopolyspora alkaliphila]|uniref:Helix-turn-helix transcriptional regulator n=1 Tax=Phytoactinopolyspora alkaliphila TaxID=1783498 RepID=A0A6N9YHX7_9ACTN|nr:helix-turn-helix transcriptional regulator [Phytoactinopolyspora alkaliphila]NED94606.1 helix-turn-helix transcriptional regulator [Phytoactinopolyspora alkaliphila]
MPDPVTIGPRGRKQPERPLLRTLLGDVLRRNRQKQGRTLGDVARAAKVSMPYLSEVERGRKEASSEVLAAICDALRLDLSDVLAEVTHNLAGGQGRRTAVIELGSFRSRRASPPARGVSSSAHASGDVQLLAA